jgi:hypothetical protein
MFMLCINKLDWGYTDELSSPIYIPVPYSVYQESDNARIIMKRSSGKKLLTLKTLICIAIPAKLINIFKTEKNSR